MGKKRRKIWFLIPLCIFWSIWKERNCIAFRDGIIVVQKLKCYFVYRLWNRVYLGNEVTTPFDLFEWMASN